MKLDCWCGTARSAEDPSVLGIFNVAGVRARLGAPGDLDSLKQRRVYPPRIRACRDCGTIYVAALAGVPEP